MAESNIDWEKETEESLYDRLAYNIHMPQVIFVVQFSYDDDDVKIKTGEKEKNNRNTRSNTAENQKR